MSIHGDTIREEIKLSIQIAEVQRQRSANTLRAEASSWFAFSFEGGLWQVLLNLRNTKAKCHGTVFCYTLRWLCPLVVKASWAPAILDRPYTDIARFAGTMKMSLFRADLHWGIRNIPSSHVQSQLKQRIDWQLLIDLLSISHRLLSLFPPEQKALCNSKWVTL